LNIEEAKKRLGKMPVASPQQEAIKNAVGAVIEIGEALNLVVTKLSKKVYDLEDLLQGGAKEQIEATIISPNSRLDKEPESEPKPNLPDDEAPPEDGKIKILDDSSVSDPAEDDVPRPDPSPGIEDSPNDEAPSIPDWRKELGKGTEK